MLRAFYVIVFLWGSSLSANAQTTAQRHALHFGFLWTDYNSLDPVYQASNKERFLHPDDLNYALGLGYQYAINSSFVLGLTGRFGSMDAHHLRYSVTDSLCQPCERRLREEFFISADVVGQYQFANGYVLSENFFWRPYLFLGMSLVHMSQRDIKPDFQLPMGLGFRFHLSPSFALNVQAEYRKSLLVTKDNLALSASIVWLLEPAKEN